MTSEKYFSKWVREAGRGHLTALLAWGSLLLYGIITAAQLRFKSDYFFFGMGTAADLRGTRRGHFLSGVFLPPAAQKTGFLLQPSGEEKHRILEQVCTRAGACFHSAVPGDYGLRTV